MKRILITGISGFVGTNLISFFRSKTEFELFGHSRTYKSFGAVKFLETINSENLDQNNIDVLIHLAGIAHDLSGQYKPEDYYKVNFEGT